MQLHSAGVPTVLAVSERFRSLALSILRSKGTEALPLLVLPADVEQFSNEELQSLAENDLPHALELLREDGKAMEVKDA